MYSKLILKISIILLFISTIMDAEFIRDDNKEVVIDTTKNLMWQDDKKAKEIKKDWQGGMNYCQNLNFAGYDDWYLPSRDELLSLATLGFYGTAYNNDSLNNWIEENKHKRQKESFVNPVFQNMTLNIIWSSTTHPSDSTTAFRKNHICSWKVRDSSKSLLKREIPISNYL